MDYRKIYDKLIGRAKARVIEGYVEVHHIVPRCMNGTNETDNLVELTPEEHYLAHQLLVKMYPDHGGLVKAASMMGSIRSSNKIYGWVRRKLSLVMKDSQAGEKNSNYGNRWVYNVEMRQSKLIAKCVSCPEGWHEGRVIDFDIYERKQIEQSKKIEQQKQEDILRARKRIKRKHNRIRRSLAYRKSKSRKLFKQFTESNLSLRKFAKTIDANPMTLSNLFNEFEDSYNAIPRKSYNN